MGILLIISQVLSFITKAAVIVATIALELFQTLAIIIIDFVKNNKQFSLGFLCGAVAVAGIWYFVEKEFDDAGEEIPRPINTYTINAIEAATGNVIVIKKGLFKRRKGAVTLSKIGVPELVAAYGPDARNALHEMVAGLRITIDRYPDDVAWSGVAYTPEGLCVQQELVRRGLAWATGQFWKKEEQEAKKNKLGIWSSLHADSEG